MSMKNTETMTAKKINAELLAFSKSGVLPSLCSETGADDEPLEDVIICDLISGGAQYENDMPKMLQLTRMTKDFTQYHATYVQIPDVSTN